MGITKIPEKIITTCDCCGLIKEENRKAFTMNGRISFHSEGLDYQGEAVGPGDNTTSIFCNGCYEAVKRGLIEYLKKYKKEPVGDE
jgi:hypothetical protein